MATKPGIAAPLIAAVSPADIQRAKEAAVAAYTEAYTPIHPVKTAAGQVLMCWFGRVDNAYDALARAEGEKRAMIQGAVEDLGRRAKVATNAAEQAVSDYTAKCLAANQVPDEISAPRCECDGCQSASYRQRYWSAVQTVREAMMDLFLPEFAGDQVPKLLGLSDEETAAGIRALKDACQGLVDMSEQPIDWMEVIR